MEGGGARTRNEIEQRRYHAGVSMRLGSAAASFSGNGDGEDMV